MDNTSKYDPTRDTVGAIYRDAQINGPKDRIDVGEMRREVMSSLVEDLNETIKSKPHGDRPFYITVHEKKDLQMPNALLRRIITTVYRPWPEDDTLVFWVDPTSNEVRYCWCLPHWSEMDNVLMNPTLYEADYVREIKAWKSLELHIFGFHKDEMGNWIPNPNFIDKKLTKPKPAILMADGTSVF